MATYTPLSPLPSYHWHGEEAGNLRDELNVDISAMIDRRQALEESIASARNTDVADVDYKAVKATEKYREKRFSLLQAEIPLRQRMSEFYLLQNADANKQVSLLSGMQESWPKELAKRLESLGYKPFDRCKPVQGSWLPGFIQSHPKTIELRANLEQVRSVMRNREEGNPGNLTSIMKVKENLEGTRSSMIAVS